MKYFLGLDIGNTKSHALLADETGRAVGFGQAGPGSWEAIGWDGAQEVLCDLTNMVLDQAGISRADIWGAGFGYAGYDWPEDRPSLPPEFQAADNQGRASAYHRLPRSVRPRACSVRFTATDNAPKSSTCFHPGAVSAPPEA